MQVVPRSEGEGDATALGRELHLADPVELGRDGVAVQDGSGLTIIEPGTATGQALGSRRGSALAKRSLDLAIVIVAAPLWITVYVVISAAIVLNSGLPIHYTELRVGRDGRRFTCIKFRSMRRDRGEHRDHRLHRRVTKSRDDPRLTRVGRTLRRSSLDEIPQLLNVLAGQMSLVGPRPVTPREIARYYGPHAPEVLAVRPGLTGLWQISGRSLLPMEARVELDLRYARERSIRTDLSILLRTIPSVVRGHGAY